MALIGRIRNNLWLVVILLGLAMAGFLLMEATGSSGSGVSLFGNPTSMGTVAGQNIDALDFDNKIRTRYSGAAADQYTLKNALWNSLINESIIANEGEKLGLSITDSEMEGLVYGPNFSPIIVQGFSRQGQYGQVDIEQLNQIRDLEATGKLNPEYVPIWAEQKEMVKRDRMQSKLTNLVSKSIYTPSWMVNMKNNDNASANFSFVKVPFDYINNSEIALEDADYSAYLKKNSSTYTTDTDQQTLDYIIFKVEPTSADSAEILKELGELNNQYKTEENVRIFTESNQGTFDEAYAFKDAVNGDIADELFSDELGSVYGPYLDKDATNGQDIYRIAKLLDRKVIPDSVSARHILIGTDPQIPGSAQAARDTIDKIMGILEEGVITFDSLATKYSTDGGSKINGGDLGTFTQGRMVKPFNDACFFNSTDKYKVVESQFGVHLIEVTKTYNKSGKKGVKVAYIQRPIVPSKATIKDGYKKALEFASSHRSLDAMKKAASDLGMEVYSSNPVDENGYTLVSGVEPSTNLEGGESSRSLIKWANEASVGDVSPSVYRYSDPVRFYENRYVVAGVASKQKAGLPSVASMKNTIGNLVMNEKKGAMLSSQLAGMGDDLTAIATKYESKVDSMNTTLSNASVDAKLLANVFGLEAGQTTKPIIGNDGVYVAKLIAKPDAPAVTDIPGQRNRISSTSRASVRGGLLPALKKEADIEDKRNKFF